MIHIEHNQRPVLDPVADLMGCQNAVRNAEWWQRSGIPEHWPLSSDEAAAMLALAGEYAVDAAGLHDLIGRGLLPRPAVGENDAFEWSAVDMCTAAGLLDARRQWRRAPNAHDPKRSPCEHLADVARGLGTLPSIVHGGPVRFDVRHLLQMLVEHNNHESRRKVATLLQAVLEVDHNLYI